MNFSHNHIVQSTNKVSKQSLPVEYLTSLKCHLTEWGRVQSQPVQWNELDGHSKNCSCEAALHEIFKNLSKPILYGV